MVVHFSQTFANITQHFRKYNVCICVCLCVYFGKPICPTKISYNVNAVSKCALMIKIPPFRRGIASHLIFFFLFRFFFLFCLIPIHVYITYMENISSGVCDREKRGKLLFCMVCVCTVHVYLPCNPYVANERGNRKIKFINHYYCCTSFISKYRSHIFPLGSTIQAISHYNLD